MTLGNDDKRHFAVLPDNAESRVDGKSALKSPGSDHDELQLSIVYESEITAPDRLQQLILQQQALPIPSEVFKSKLGSVKKFLDGIKAAQHETENKLDHDISKIFNDFEKYAYKLQKYAVCKTNGIIDEAYSENYHNCMGELQHGLSVRLQEGLAEVMAPLYIDMAEYIHAKLDQILQGFIEGTEALIEQIYRQSVDLLGLQQEIKVKIPPLRNEALYYAEVNDGTFTESSPDFPTDNLPESFVYPLLLKEIKMRIPVEVEKRFHDFNLYCWDYIQKISWSLKNNMKIMVEESLIQLKALLDKAAIQMESQGTRI
ncbi:MAG: hypothetical protein VB084_03385 [Syntrophomonadaceae bacterium]|nr:hypothetical protein [Syntrophomonadaceae bacterium]